MSEDVTTEKKEDDKTERDIYELGFHIAPALGEDGAPKEALNIKKYIEKLGGTFISEEALSHITLAYEMVRTRGGKREKFASAYFGTVKFELNRDQAQTLKENVEENDNVVRYLLFKTAREDTRAPKRVMQAQQPAPKPTDPKKVAPIEPKLTEVTKEEKEAKGKVSEEELDRTIKELVVE